MNSEIKECRVCGGVVLPIDRAKQTDEIKERCVNCGAVPIEVKRNG